MGGVGIYDFHVSWKRISAIKGVIQLYFWPKSSWTKRVWYARSIGMGPGRSIFTRFFLSEPLTISPFNHLISAPGASENHRGTCTKVSWRYGPIPVRISHPSTRITSEKCRVKMCKNVSEWVSEWEGEWASECVTKLYLCDRHTIPSKISVLKKGALAIQNIYG